MGNRVRSKRSLDRPHVPRARRLCRSAWQSRQSTRRTFHRISQSPITQHASDHLWSSNYHTGIGRGNHCIIMHLSYIYIYIIHVSSCIIIHSSTYRTHVDPNRIVSQVTELVWKPAIPVGVELITVEKTLNAIYFSCCMSSLSLW